MKTKFTKLKIIAAVCAFGIIGFNLIIILALLGGTGSEKNALAASADNPQRLAELAVLSSFGIPCDIVFMVTTLQSKTEKEALEKPFIFTAMEFMEVTEIVKVMEHNHEEPESDGESEEVIGDGGDGSVEEIDHSSCNYQLSSTTTISHKDAIKGYLEITIEDGAELTAQNLQQKLQEAADKKSAGNSDDDIREIHIGAIPSSDFETGIKYGEYSKAIERCGIKNKKEIQGILDLHDQGYFIGWLEGASVKFDIDGGSGPFVTGSNGSHAHIRTLLANDDAPFEGGSFVSPLDGDWRGHISCEFGTGYVGHTGMDLGIGVSVGTPIHAVADGTVLYVSHASGSYNGGYNAYGIHIVINHGGRIATMYAHNSQALVSAGETVQAGQPIALLGNTGNSTGPHLHLEVIANGVPKNPRQFLP